MNPYVTVVNQRHYFARLLLEKCHPAEDPHGHAGQALTQSAVYQLEAAYRSHLRAIAFEYRCADPENIVTVQHLVSALRAVDKHPAEAAELDNLEGDDQSWLFALLTAHAALTGSRAVDAAAGIEKLGISLKDVTNGREQGLSADRVEEWLSAFDELVNRHREMMVEC